ncbi:hypothetical protein [Atopobium sp. ICM42b]|uniref:hypothetical protein n=1 Tax=Atopobium sp. ICM42b TaxID=1190620 RepID=UPI0004BBC34E|nr:hypothetical protein [Atopobium sp. ICM42b]
MSTPKSSSTSKCLSADDRADVVTSADAATSADADAVTSAAAAAKPVTYTYDRRRYVIDVLLPNYVSIVVFIAAVVLFALGFIRWLMLFLVVVCLYSILNAFLAHAYPEQVILAPDSITFVTGKHKSTYKLSQITQIRVREAPQGLRSYVRINKVTPLQGRFYLTCGDMTDAQGNDAREVYKLLLDLEAKLDPNGLRVRARRQQQKGE